MTDAKDQHDAGSRQYVYDDSGFWRRRLPLPPTVVGYDYPAYTYDPGTRGGPATGPEADVPVIVVADGGD